MLRQATTFNVEIEDEAQVLSALRTYQEATGIDLVTDLLDTLHDLVRTEESTGGSIWLCDADNGDAFWSDEGVHVRNTDMPLKVEWEWVDTTADYVVEGV